MTYIFMAVHYPAEGKLDRTRVVGVSRWESRAAFEAAMPGSGVANNTIHPGESRPREYYHLESAP